MICCVCDKDLSQKQVYGEKINTTSYSTAAACVVPNKQGTCISVTCSKECYDCISTNLT